MDLSNTGIDGSGLLYLKQLPIKRLALANTKVTDAELKDIGVFRKLEDLDLTNARLSDNAMEHLAKCPSLKKLEIVNCKISQDAIRKITKGRPDIVIIR